MSLFNVPTTLLFGNDEMYIINDDKVFKLDNRRLV